MECRILGFWREREKERGNAWCYKTAKMTVISPQPSLLDAVALSNELPAMVGKVGTDRRDQEKLNLNEAHQKVLGGGVKLDNLSNKSPKSTLLANNIRGSRTTKHKQSPYKWGLGGMARDEI